MTRNEVLRKIEEARSAIRDFKEQNLEKAFTSIEIDKVKKIREASSSLIVEARTIGASGRQCPHCSGSGRV